MRTRYLVAYDIRDERRLRLTNKTVKAFGYSLQYSVFVCDLTRAEKTRLRGELSEIINSAVDSVVFIDLGSPSARGVECFEFMGVRDQLPIDGTATIL